MPEISLLQTEADALIAMEKVKVDNNEYEYPSLGGRITVPIASRNKRENFLLDISRMKIDLLKGSYQNRAFQIIVLVRLDFGGQPHRNPDGQEIHSPHIHVYREGYGDKWAFTVPRNIFVNMNDLWQTLQDFMKYCKIVEQPNIVKGLFQ